MVEGLGRSTSTRFLTKTDSGATGVRVGWMLASNARWTWPVAQSRPRRSPQDYGTFPKAVTRSVTRTPRDRNAQFESDETT